MTDLKNNDDKKSSNKISGEIGKYVQGAIGGAIAALAVECCILLYRKLINVPVTKKDILENAKDSVGDFNASLRRNHTENEESAPDINNRSYILLDRIGHKGEMIAFVAKAKVGKTWVAINIAENWNSGRVLYLLLDDITRTQEIRFKKDTLKNKLHLVTTPNWKEGLAALKEKAETGCTQKAFWDALTPAMTKINDRRERLMRELGISDERKVDNILLFESLMESPWTAQFDTVILDNLNSLMEHPGKIIQHHLERLISCFAGKDKTFVLLHHINKSGEISGSSAFAELVNTVVTITPSDDTGNLLLVDASTSRHIQGFKYAIVEKISTGPNSVDFRIVEEFNSSPAAASRPNLDTVIMGILSGVDEMTHNELYNRLRETRGELNPSSVRNSLKRLEDAGYIRKGGNNGKTWDTIIVMH